MVECGAHISLRCPHDLNAWKRPMCLKSFSNRCVFVENGQGISVDGRPKCIEMYAFSNENALDHTRPSIMMKIC